MGVQTPTTLKRQAAELMAMVPDGARVLAGALSTAPTHLLDALADRARLLEHLELAAGMFLTDYTFLEPPAVSFRTWFPPGTVGKRTVDPTKVAYLPMSWSQVISWASSGEVDVLLLQLSPADQDGFHSFGTSASYTAPAAGAARLILAEINHRQPFTYGARIHHSRLDGFVEVDEPLPTFPRKTPTEADLAIAHHVATLIGDECTLQLGVGSVPDAVLGVLAQETRQGIRIHGNASNGLMDLVARGCVSDDDDAILVGEALGDQTLYDFIDHNPGIRMVGGDRTHGARALMEVPRLVSLGAALSVDVYGQVNTEYVDGRHVGAVGGAIDFTRAANWPGNTSIIALRSTTSDGTRSRIVSSLDAATVSLPRDSTQLVVTEHGVADLRNKTVAERRDALTAIAHPAFRAQLEVS